MSYSSDEFDGEIRGVLYDLRDKLDDNLSDHKQVKFLRSSIEAAIFQADDFRLDLLDQEDDEEELEMARNAAEEIGDAKCDEKRHGI